MRRRTSGNKISISSQGPFRVVAVVVIDLLGYSHHLLDPQSNSPPPLLCLLRLMENTDMANNSAFEQPEAVRRLGFVSDLTGPCIDLQRSILEVSGMPFEDMELEQLQMPFPRADYVHKNAVEALQILCDIAVPGIVGSSECKCTHTHNHTHKHTHTHTHKHTQKHTHRPDHHHHHPHIHTHKGSCLIVHLTADAGNQTILRGHDEAHKFFHHVFRMVSYTMFCITNRPMGHSVQSLKEKMEEAEVHVAAHALWKIIKLMEGQMYLMERQMHMAGPSNQVMCVAVISELSC